MALDLRTRKQRSRSLDRDPVFMRKGICSGSLTPGTAIPSGSSVGQVPQVQPASTNLLFNTFAPQLAPWVLNGTAGFTGLSANDQFDPNFIPAIFFANAPGDFVDNPSVAVAAITAYSVSAQFSIIGSSTAVRVGVNWTGGVARFDSVDLNPHTGQILAASANVANVFVSSFQSRNQANQVVTIVSLAFTTAIVPAATNAGDFRLFPSLTGGGANVFAGGFQVEALTPPSAFIPTPVNGTASRQFGVTSRLSTDRTERIATLAANYSYQPVLDNGAEFNITAEGVTFTLPNGVGQANPGEWCDIYFSATTFFTLAIGGIGVIQGPGVAGAGVTSVNFPQSVTTGVGPYNVCGIRAICLTPATWKFQGLAEAHGTLAFTGNGTFNFRQGMTSVWVDGVAAGGGGGGSTTPNSAGGGGASGDGTLNQVFTTTPGTSASITIGTAGTGGAAGNNNGVAGGNTIVGALVTFSGGTGGGGAPATTSANGGAGVGANSIAGNNGFVIVGNYAQGGAGAASLHGQGGLSNPTLTSLAGSNGQGIGGSGGSGGGSGPASANQPGGNGRPGYAVVKW